jgi:Na+-driven multidrug efflux pump
MMSIEGPFLSALIARLDEPKYNLAAYGVAFALALIIEAPVIMMMSASTAIVKDEHSFFKLKRFTYLLSSGLTLIMIILIIPPVFYFIAEDLIGLPPKVAGLTHIATIILLPWPGSIGYRRFCQGILIRNNMTRRVAYGTIVRITTMVLTASIFFTFIDVPGVVVGASALSFAVVAEAIASRLMTRGIIKKISQVSAAGERITYKEIFHFYYPLALTSLLSMGVQPLVTFFVGKSRMALESLAVLPVITSFVFIFRAFGLSYQEVIIAKMDKDRINFIPLRNYALVLAGVLSVSLYIISFSSLSDFWFQDISGLSKALSDFSKAPLQIMAIIPALTVWISFQRAMLVNDKKTKFITQGTAIEFIIITLVMYTTVNIFYLPGAVAATSSFIVGRLAANSYFNRYVKLSTN